MHQLINKLYYTYTSHPSLNLFLYFEKNTFSKKLWWIPTITFCNNLFAVFYRWKTQHNWCECMESQKSFCGILSLKDTTPNFLIWMQGITSPVYGLDTHSMIFYLSAIKKMGQFVVNKHLSGISTQKFAVMHSCLWSFLSEALGKNVR